MSRRPLPAGVVAVGHVRSPYAERGSTPVQASLNADVHARVELRAGTSDALRGLDGFDHVWLLTWLDVDTVDDPPLLQVPFLLQRARREVGLFAMRGPRRPNPIGLSLVRLVDVDDDGFSFAGVDLLDGTPVLDVKPYVAAFDAPPGPVRSGWFDEVDLAGAPTPDSLR